MHLGIIAFAILTAAAASWLATHAVARLASNLGWVSAPSQARHVHVRPVPRLGGIAIVIGATAGLVAAIVVNREALAGAWFRPPVVMIGGLIAGGGIAFGAGLIDDLRGLRPLAKLAAQIAAALVVYELGFRIEVISVGTGAAALGWLSLPVTLLWIVGVTNAYNLVDGMDGLAAGLGVIAFGAIAAAAAMLGNGQVVVVAAALLGALLGFLPHNFNPARIFLGDSGSLFVGFVLAVLSVQGSMKSATAVMVAVPLFALFIPLLDTAVAILRRWIRGTPIMEADDRHIHHRLAAVGFSHRDAVLLLYLFAAAFAGLGILLGFAPPRQLAAIAVAGGVASGLVIVSGMRRLQYDEFLLAGKVLATGPLRFRKAIRDRMLAEEVAREIERTESLDELQRVLAEAAPRFGLAELEVAGAGVRHSGAGNRFPHSGITSGANVHPWEVPTWQLEYPLPRCGEAGIDLALHMAGSLDRDRRTSVGERAIHVLVAAVDAQLTRQPVERRKGSALPVARPDASEQEILTA